MKEQKFDSIIKLRNFTRQLRDLLFILAVSIAFVACQNDIETIHALTKELDLPDQSGKNVEFQLTDSGIMKMVFRAPAVERYMNKNSDEGPYKIFPKGIEVEMYNKLEEIESVIIAGYAEHWEEKSLWTARDSVVARNVITGERLDTEELFWDEKNQKIFSEVFTKITNEDGTYFGEEGFESDQNLENYKLIGSRGTVKVKDEELE